MKVYSMKATPDLLGHIIADPDYMSENLNTGSGEYLVLSTTKRQDYNPVYGGYIWRYTVKFSKIPQGTVISTEDFEALKIMPTEDARFQYLKHVRRETRKEMRNGIPATIQQREL